MGHAGAATSGLSAQRLAALRAEMARRGIDALLVPRADEHLGEYVPECAERLAWLTGFTGSAGLAVVLADRAALFVDGRYTVQAAEQAAPWEAHHLIDDPPAAWLKQTAPDARIGYDPWLHSEDALARYCDAGLTLAALPSNPIDAVWTDRPAPPAAPVLPHPLRWAGQSSADKRAAVAQTLRDAGQDAAIVTDPASLCWLLNLRGADVPFTPFALGFLILHVDGAAALFMAPEKLAPETRAWIGEAVTLHPRAALPDALAALRGRTVRVDRAGSPAWFAETLRAAGATVKPGADPCLLPKACKNDTEQAGARAAHVRDAVALCRFLHWLHHAAPAGGQTELSAAAELLRLRGGVADFRGESFPAISAAGPHAALPHYRVTDASNVPITPDQAYLIDSGAQYPDGTTDVTRTIWTGPATPPDVLRDRFTRVLRGHIALATLRFPRGCAGGHLDAIARRPLWDAGLDFDHGTGHGVGSYLSVHEGPAAFSRAARPAKLAPGMILSDEPGFYLPGEWGIRLENLLLVMADTAASRPFLRFDTLTLAPFDRVLIDPALMMADEICWLDAYHARVLAEIGPLVDADTRAWLHGACAPLSA